jgi:hypothetical protein
MLLLAPLPTPPQAREPDKPLGKYLVDGLLSVATHNGVHRLTFYELSGPEAPLSQPCVEIDIPAPALDSLLETLTSLTKHAPQVA